MVTSKVRISVDNMGAIAELCNHNARTFANAITKINGEICRLKRKNRSNAMAGFIFGIAVELCFLAQNQKINELEEKLSNMNEEIKELRDKEGD